MTDRQIRVLLADDHRILRSGVASMLEECDDVLVVGQAGTPAEALEKVLSMRPDVVVMDIRLGTGSGVDVTREVRAKLPGTKVVMLTGSMDKGSLVASIVAGASGYVVKEADPSALLEAIRAAASGQSTIDPSMAGELLDHVRREASGATDERLSALSPIEQRVLAFLAEGKTNREIGQELFFAERTVKKYVSQVLAKLGVSRRAEAAVYAARAGVFPETG